MRTKQVGLSLATALLLNIQPNFVKTEDAPPANIFDAAWNLVPDALKPKKDDPSDNSALVKDDFKTSFEDIVKEYGYKYSSHTVNTDDGFILETFRIRK